MDEETRHVIFHPKSGNREKSIRIVPEQQLMINHRLTALFLALSTDPPATAIAFADVVIQI